MPWEWIATRLLWANLAWYLLLSAAFYLGGNVPKSVYFLGAAILTVGIILTP